MSALTQTSPAVRSHLLVSGGGWARDYRRCDEGCVVGADGVTSCGQFACPKCGCSGTNLSIVQLVNVRIGSRIECNCGHAWVHLGVG